MKTLEKPQQQQQEQVSLFNFCGSDVRVLGRDGEPWFVLSDVCRGIGINRTISDVKKRLDLVDIGTADIHDSRGHLRKTFIINEAGLYDVIFMSRKPEAKDFKRWVTREVLPSIRKHGAYMTPQKIEDVLTSPDTIIQLATTIKQEQEARLIAEAESAAAKGLVEEQKPKVDAYDAWMSDNEALMDFNTVAKLLGVGRNTMLKTLRDLGVLMRAPEVKNLPTQRYAQHFRVGVYRVRRRGQYVTQYRVRVSPSGVELIAKKINARAGLGSL